MNKILLSVLIVFIINRGAALYTKRDSITYGTTTYNHVHDGSFLDISNSTFRPTVIVDRWPAGFFDGVDSSKRREGLKYVYEMTKGVDSELRLDLVKSTGDKGHAIFQSFSLSEPTDYRLRIGTYSGTAGASLSRFNNDRPFSTHDRNVDAVYGSNCPVHYHSGWWFGSCSQADLNGHYITPGMNRGWRGVVYYSFDETRSLKSTEMKFRRKN